MPRFSHTPRGGFTLIELLVCISVIALLISIIMPALAGSRRKAQSLICQTHLRILAEVVDRYVQTNDGWYPDTGPYPLGNTPLDINQHNNCLPHRIHRVNLSWNDPDRIHRAWYCPVKGAIPEPNGLRAKGHGTYVYNSRDLARRTTPAGALVKGQHQSRRTRISDIGLLRDLVALDRFVNPNDPKQQAWFDYAHDRGQNIVFLDGHVEYSRDRRWMLWPGTGSAWNGTPPEFPRWFNGTTPPS